MSKKKTSQQPQPAERRPYRAAERDALAEKGYVPASEVAKRVGKSPQAIYYWLQQGKLDGVRVGVHWYVKEKSLIEYYKRIDPKAVELLGLKHVG